MADNTNRFSDRVDHYIRYRPGYPSEVLLYLEQQTGLDAGWTIADIGSGTGISAEMFLKNNNKVYAVEPNKEMREAADRLLCHHAGYVSVDGTAENTTLPVQSVDLITAAQAFHWFDRAAFRREARRIARDGAWYALIWNERKVASPFEIAYEDLLIRYATDYTTVDHRNISPEDLKDFFAPSEMTTRTFYNEQLFDYEGVKGRLLSSSYAPNEGHERYEPMLAYLRQIFDAHQAGGRVGFSYDCHLYLARV
ncbi:MAG: class I SAM-dependent methyltransferase [Bacteroidetes bacterium]|nr:class I SAM-dependent methyltransferase [Bacteroidota bacterium]